MYLINDITYWFKNFAFRTQLRNLIRVFVLVWAFFSFFFCRCLQFREKKKSKSAYTVWIDRSFFYWCSAVLNNNLWSVSAIFRKGQNLGSQTHGNLTQTQSFFPWTMRQNIDRFYVNWFCDLILFLFSPIRQRLEWRRPRNKEINRSQNQGLINISGFIVTLQNEVSVWRLDMTLPF